MPDMSRHKSMEVLLRYMRDVDLFRDHADTATVSCGVRPTLEQPNLTLMEQEHDRLRNPQARYARLLFQTLAASKSDIDLAKLQTFSPEEVHHDPNSRLSTNTMAADNLSVHGI
jgi:hypothetical protein